MDRLTALELAFPDLEELFPEQHISHLAQCLLEFLPVRNEPVRGRPYEIILRYVRTFSTREGQIPSEQQRRGMARVMLRDAERHGLFEKLVEHGYAICHEYPNGKHRYALSPAMYFTDPGIRMLQ